MNGRHGGDEKTYRGLKNYQERVQSFNMNSNKLYEYTRVQIELDTTDKRNADTIVLARIKTLRKLIDRISSMAE